MDARLKSDRKTKILHHTAQKKIYTGKRLVFVTASILLPRTRLVVYMN